MHRGITLLYVCMSAYVFAAPAHAAGTWQQEVAASGAANPVDTIDVSIGADGHAAVVWERNGGGGWDRTVHLRRRSPAGIWGPVENVSTPYADAYAPDQAPYSTHDNPSVAVDASGNTLVTWVTAGGTGPGRQGNIYLEAYAPVGQPVGPQRVFATDANGSSGAARTDVQFGPSGEALITWVEVDEQLHSIVREPNGTVGAEAIVPKSAPNADMIYQDISCGRDGSAVLAWSEGVHVVDHFINRAFAAIRRPGGAWSTPQLLEEDVDPEHYAFQMRAGVATDGSAMVAFNNFTPGGPLPLRLVASPRGASSFGPTRLLPEVDGAMTMYEMVAGEPGHASIVGFGGSWSKKRPIVADVTAEGGPATITALGDAEMTPGPLHPRVAASFDASGGLHLAWSAIPDERADDSRPLYLYRAFRPEGSSFGPLVVSPNGSGWIDDLTLATGSAGDAISAWTAGDTFRNRELYLSAFEALSDPIPGPTPTPAAPVPSATVTPAPTTTPAPTSTGPTPAPPERSAPIPADSHADAEPRYPVQQRAPRAPGTATEAALSSRTPDRAPGSVRSGVQPGSRCTIPDVRGDTLARAKRRLMQAHCRVGTVRYVRDGRPGRVVRQNTPGVVRAEAFSVALVVARRGPSRIG